jgi:hypothetical protein
MDWQLDWTGPKNRPEQTRLLVQLYKNHSLRATDEKPVATSYGLDHWLWSIGLFYSYKLIQQSSKLVENWLSYDKNKVSQTSWLDANFDKSFSL